jgi:hypothetical protein
MQLEMMLEIFPCMLYHTVERLHDASRLFISVQSCSWHAHTASGKPDSFM